MNSSGFRKWLAIGTGIGIEIAPADLNVTVARVRPQGASILGEFSIHRFREQPASEWGRNYAAFLKKLGVNHLAATALLPRDAIVVRQVTLPGVSDRDLPAAIRFELDGLHPYGEGDAIFDWARIGKTPSVLVGIARRDAVEEYATLFAEAGVKVRSFTFPAPVLYSALRLLETPPAEGFVALNEPAGATSEIEVYGESPARPLFSASLDASPERVRALAIAELRLDPDTEPLPLSEALPAPLAGPPELNLARTALPYATALAGACPQLALSVNLLPPEQRQGASRWLYAPSLALALLALLLAGAALAYPGVANRRYAGLLQAEILRLQPQAAKAAKLDRLIATTRNRTQSLDNFRRQTREDMDALRELTKILAPPTWLTSLQLTRDSVTISGEAEQAAALLKLLDSSRQFKGSDFSLPIARTSNGESFSIRSSRQAAAQ